jgi:hypothetical protein
MPSGIAVVGVEQLFQQISSTMNIQAATFDQFHWKLMKLFSNCQSTAAVNA